MPDFYGLEQYYDDPDGTSAGWISPDGNSTIEFEGTSTETGEAEGYSFEGTWGVFISLGSTDGSGEAMWVNITIAGEDAADVAVEAAKIIAREDLTAAEKLQLVTELVETNGGTVTTETTDSGEKKSFIKKFFGKKKRDALEGFMAEENAPWSRPNLNQWANGKGILREMEVRS